MRAAGVAPVTIATRQKEKRSAFSLAVERAKLMRTRSERPVREQALPPPTVRMSKDIMAKS
jgi:hypothetical protein